ncbi:hypothetical protein Tco_0014514 [Tanacetum coccineum]
MGSEAIEVPALKEEEFAQITVLGVHVSFPNGTKDLKQCKNGDFQVRGLTDMSADMSILGCQMVDQVAVTRTGTNQRMTRVQNASEPMIGTRLLGPRF